MAEKSALTQVVQVGLEGTAGTPVAADVMLQSISISPAAKVEVDTHRPKGLKFPTLAVLNKEWAEASIEGKPTYDEVVYLLASVLGTPVVTTAPGGTLGKLWTFDVNSDVADTPATYTVEAGEAGATDGIRFAFGTVNEFELKASRDALEVTGNMLGTAIETNHTMTATPATLPVVPVQPGHVCLYLDDTAVALGTTKLGRAFDLSVKLSDRHSAVWAIDCQADSFVATVEGEPSAEVTLLLAFDAVGQALFNTLRAGATKFLRMEATGPQVETGVNYRWTFDLALKVTDVAEFSDNDGIYAVEFTFAVVHDATWGRALMSEVVNTTANL